MLRQLFIGLGLLAALPGVASADEDRRHVEVVAGAGYGNFTGDLGAVTNGGFAWSGRVGYQFIPALGAEVNYQGLNSSFSDVILSNGVFVGGFSVLQQTISANGRAGVPIRMQDSQLYLYGLAGAGYSNIWMSQGGFFVGSNSDSAFLVPVGGGASFILPSGFMLDGRFTYNVLSGDRSPLIQTGNSWTAALNLGSRFGP